MTLPGPARSEEQVYTRTQILELLDQAADDIESAVTILAEPCRDAVNLLINTVGHRLQHPSANLRAVVEDDYTAPYDEVLSWLAD